MGYGEIVGDGTLLEFRGRHGRRQHGSGRTGRRAKRAAPLAAGRDDRRYEGGVARGKELVGGGRSTSSHWISIQQLKKIDQRIILRQLTNSHTLSLVRRVIRSTRGYK